MARVGLAACLGCAPEFVDEPWRVSEARVLAIAAEPPEARPGESVTLAALVVDPDGERLEVPQWSFCTRPRTGAERTAVTQACLEEVGLTPTPAVAQVLPDACARFGPNPPPAEAGAPAQRPADPDASGGYYLPVRVELQAAQARAFGSVRLRCDLPGVTRAIFDAYEDRYQNNLAPTLGTVAFDGRPVDSVAAVASVLPGADVVVSVELPATAAESFVVYDSAQGALRERRETVVVRWFVPEGQLDAGQARIEATGGGPLRAETVWQVPELSGDVPLWVVATDERGAATWLSVVVEVE